MKRKKDDVCSGKKVEGGLKGRPFHVLLNTLFRADVRRINKIKSGRGSATKLHFSSAR